MRETKYRIIYLEEEERRVHGNKPSFWSPEYVTCSLSYVLSNPSIYAVSQFTGLKDKNGNEIYEGDIFRWQDSKMPWLVEWDEEWACFGMIRSNGGEDDFGGGYEKDYEIIGNIYESPKLLED